MRLEETSSSILGKEGIYEKGIQSLFIAPVATEDKVLLQGNHHPYHRISVDQAFDLPDDGRYTPLMSPCRVNFPPLQRYHLSGSGMWSIHLATLQCMTVNHLGHSMCRCHALQLLAVLGQAPQLSAFVQ